MSVFEKGSLYVGTYFGIPVKIHWTFGYIIFYIIYTGYKDNMGTMGALWFGIFMMSLFVCVILHEYGHALAARRYGVKTMDIILTPLGGIARLLKMPDKPWQELIVALAGPMVNVVIAAAIFLVMYFGFDIHPVLTLLAPGGDPYDFHGHPDRFFSMLMLTNVALLFFNLLPVFPMDGGRVLRSLIALRLNKVRATLIATRIGQVFSIFFFLYGIYSSNYILALIGIFIFQGAYMEYRYTKAEHILQNTTVEDLGYADFQYFQHDDLIINARELLSYTEQPFFPVLNGAYAEGSVSRENIAQAQDLYQPVACLPLRSIPEIPHNAPWMTCYQLFSQDKADAVFLIKEGQRMSLLDKWTFYHQMAEKKLLRQAGR